MARRIEEADFVARFQLNLIGTNMLSNPASLARHDIRRSQSIEQ